MIKPLWPHQWWRGPEISCPLSRNLACKRSIGSVIQELQRVSKIFLHPQKVKLFVQCAANSCVMM